MALESLGHAVANLSITIDKTTGEVVWAFKLKDGSPRSLHIHAGLLGSLIPALMGASGALASGDPSGANTQPVTLTSARKAVYHDGQPMLVATLEHTFQMPILLPEGAIPALQNALTELAELTSGATKEAPTPKH